MLKTTKTVSQTIKVLLFFLVLSHRFLRLSFFGSRIFLAALVTDKVILAIILWLRHALTDLLRVHNGSFGTGAGRDGRYAVDNVLKIPGALACGLT
jgi:hypothetical protein